MEKIKNFNLKLERNAQVIGILSKNHEILDKVSRFHDHYGVLVSNQKKLIDLNLLYCNDLTSLEKSKNDKRNELIDNTMTVIRILQAFATDDHKKKLQLRLEHLTPEFLHECPDMGLIKVSKKAWQIANQYGSYSTSFVDKIKLALNPENSKTNLKFEAKYGLNPVMIKNIEESTIGFIGSILQYQEAIKEKELVAIEMKMILKQSKKLLTNKIDKFALLSESKNPQFYNEYSQAREKQNIKPIPEIIEQDLEFQDIKTVESEEKDETKSKRKVVPVIEE